jgi:leader peptidase (prepilin peptidase) / N-methyltransferase
MLEIVGATLFGAIVGSFLNVVIHRVPRQESIVRPPSACPRCGIELRPVDNIPLVSYLLLRGRCRTCREPISLRYPLVEAGNAALWAAAVARFGLTEEAAFVAFISSLLLALALIDLEHRRLPNVIVLPGLAAATVWLSARALISAEWRPFTVAVTCAAIAFLLFFLIALISGGMGMGDVKLSAFVGLVGGRFGWEVAVSSVMAGFFIGDLIAVGLLVGRRVGRKQAIPFGPSMAVGCIVAVFAGVGPVRAWLGL